MAYKKDSKPQQAYKEIIISLASPNGILEKSHGEVLKPETINHRTYKPERDGLFCERIFGPVKDYECACGKYKRIRYRGLICDRCGVEVTEKRVRRERMGHIKLVAPVVHVWYFRSAPNKISYLLGIAPKKLETIIYYENYAVIQPGVLEERGLKKGDLLTEDEFMAFQDMFRTEDSPYYANNLLPDDDPNKFVAKMGAEAISDLLSSLDIDELSYSLRDIANRETAQQKKADALKRLSVVEAFRNANSRIENRPEWMILHYIPVIPPELRPLVPLDGGRFASADLNDLYRRLLIRNNRLKRLIEIKAPEVILRNEKRMLQEAVDVLIDNSKKSTSVKAEGGRSLKSLSEVLKGKQGRFRQNLLGKRVDYSGRSVIVVGPDLQLHECGLPKDMAAELFKPFIIRRLLDRGIVKTSKSGKKMVERKDPMIWDVLENVLKGHPVLLNRAPTLHRLSIQAFQPKLIGGKAIQLHPLVCSSFNADFDGDQMAVHVPLSNEAILEAQLLMLSSHNILNPQNGMPITLPSQDMVLGLYYISKMKRSTETEPVLGEGKIFYSPEEVIIAYNERRVDLHAVIKVRVQVRNEDGGLETKLLETSVGRVLFNQVVPKSVGFVNELLTKSKLRAIIGNIIEFTSIPETARFLDDIKNMGFRMAFKGGLSFSINDLKVPDDRDLILDKARKEVESIQDSYENGLITNNERYNKVVDIWSKVDSRITESLVSVMKNDRQGFNSVYMMLDSGARGSKQQVKQLAGIRGLMAKPRKSSGMGSEIIENPILSNFKDGLREMDYFISTHGARKGLTDTALKTADAGYLTRRLVDVAQDVVITQYDCGTLRGIPVTAVLDSEDKLLESLADGIVGRTSLHDIFHPKTEKLLVAAGEIITVSQAKLIESLGIENVEIRSVLTCESRRGVCAACYGENLATGGSAQTGDTVGIVAAQSIGEPGTQLTLRTFHVGGVASATEVKDRMVSRFSGKVQFDGVRVVKKGKDVVVIGRTGEIRIIDDGIAKMLSSDVIPYGSTLFIKDGQQIQKGDLICTWDGYNNVIVSEISGTLRFENIVPGITYREEIDEQTGKKEKVVMDSRDRMRIPALVVENEKESKSYALTPGSYISLEEGADVESGQVLVKIPRVLGKSRDITGGLPRITELFEARNPSSLAVVSEIDGIVKMGAMKRGNRELTVVSKEGVEKKYLIASTQQMLVQDGDFVRSGMPLSDGAISPHDILKIKGPFALQQYLVSSIQEVYRLQGVQISNKHIEVIVRQMMHKVVIRDQGDTRFLAEDFVDRFEFIEENDNIFSKKVIVDVGDSETLRSGQILSLRELHDEMAKLKKQNKRLPQYRDALPATASPVLLGITKASLGVSSWMSAASFQETTKILSHATIEGKVDSMIGLKENVIAGKLIPAGTGMQEFANISVANENFHIQHNSKTVREVVQFDNEE